MPQALPLVLTRKIVLGQVMMIHDLLGFACPFTLLGKMHLRETSSQKLGWDDQLNSAPSGSVSSALCFISSTSQSHCSMSRDSVLFYFFRSFGSLIKLA